MQSVRALNLYVMISRVFFSLCNLMTKLKGHMYSLKTMFTFRKPVITSCHLIALASALPFVYQRLHESELKARDPCTFHLQVMLNGAKVTRLRGHACRCATRTTPIFASLDYCTHSYYYYKLSGIGPGWGGGGGGGGA